jgi:transcriptional regulator with XRE-family HTH domain
MNSSRSTRPEAVGKRLELTREALGFATQREFYAPIRRGASSSSMWESGERYPSIQNALLLCLEYGLTLDWIFRGDISSLPHKTALKIKAEMTRRGQQTGETLDFTNSEEMD